MANLAKIARPTHAVITNIGLSHIENLGSQERILAEKLHITDAFTPDSILYLNGDDVHLAALQRTTTTNTQDLLLALSHGATSVHGTSKQARTDPALHFTPVGPCYDVKIPVPSTHNVLNALAALAVVKGLGGDLHKAQGSPYSLSATRYAAANPSRQSDYHYRRFLQRKP